MFMNIIKFLLKKIIPKKFHLGFVNYIKGFSVKSYSQEGEDMILMRLFENINYKGFYVDIGAHHPLRFSNTYFFYKKGWSGINVDAMPGSMKSFTKERSRDINLEFPIFSSKQTLSYFAFEEPALNTLSQENANEIILAERSKLLFKKDIETHTLKEVLDKYLVKDKKIDFLSIDVEGVDYEVLISNDWSRYIPTYILVEAYSTDIKDVLKSKIYLFLESLGYELISKTPNTVIYRYKK